MKGAPTKPVNATVKLVMVAPPAVDLLAVFQGLATAWQGSMIREYPLAGLRALRWQFPYRRNAMDKELAVSVHALTGSPHHLAVREALLGNTDGILFLLPLDPRQRQACIQSMQETSHIVKQLGADLRDMPLALFYTQAHLATANAIRDWDRLLECDRYQIPRFCLHSATDEGAQLAIHALIDRILATPRLRVL